MNAAAAVVLLLTAVAIDAAVVPVTLTTVTVYGSTPRNLNLASSTANWEFDEFGQQLTQTGGVFHGSYRLNPVSTVWTHLATDMILSMGNTTASSFSCVEGNYGALVNNNYCAGYSFGPNFVDESTSSWGPGLAHERTIGGDDYVFAGIFSLGVYSNFRVVSWDGATLGMGNPGCYGGGDCNGGWDGGLLFTLQAQPVPAPAAAWLLGTAVASLGGRKWLRRKTL